MNLWFVYVLECNDDKRSLYTGMTNNLSRRLAQHNKGIGSKYTRGRLPVTLMATYECRSKSDALKLERRIKKLPKKDKLNYKP